MGKPEKILKKWRERRPVEVGAGEVKTVLNFYFPGEWDWEKGSHIVVRSKILKDIPHCQHYQPYGELTIPVKSGQKVKGFYIKGLIKAIDIIQEYKES